MKNVIALALLWLGLIVESTLFQITPFNVVKPNIVLVVLVVVALMRGARAALVLGVLIGFIQDVDYGSFIGLYAFTYGVIGYFAAASFAQFLHKNVAITFLITLVFTAVNEIITYGIALMFDMAGFAWRTMLSHLLSQMMVNGVALLVLYPLLATWLATKSRARYEQGAPDTIS